MVSVFSFIDVEFANSPTEFVLQKITIFLQYLFTIFTLLENEMRDTLFGIFGFGQKNWGTQKTIGDTFWKMLVIRRISKASKENT